MSRNIGDLERNKFFDTNGNTPGVRVGFADGPNIDAFSRLRVSNPNVIFNAMEPQGPKTYIYTSAIAGSAAITFVTGTAAHAFETTTANGDKATRQSKRLAEYVAGTSLIAIMTGVMGAGALNSRQRIGLFDDNDGLFFEQRNGVLGITVRTSTSGTPDDTHVTQSSWNIDAMNGSGKSGVTIDVTKANIFIIDLQWLGVGRVRFGFDVDGMIYWCHEVLNANALSQVYMGTPRLPIRYQVENVDTSTALTDFRQICATVITEGSKANDQLPRSVNNGIVGIATSTTKVPVLSLRLQTGVVGKGNFKLINFSAVTTAKADHLWSIWLNPTLTGASFANLDGIVAKDVAASAVTGGTLLDSFYSSEVDKSPLVTLSDKQFAAGAGLDGTADIICVTAQALTGTDTAYAALGYEELY